MRPVLLRCIDIGIFMLPNGQMVNPADLAAMQGKLLSSLRGKNAAEINAANYILTLPAHRCLLTNVPVTKHESRLLRKTLPWVLEDRLLEPVETQHFAIGNITASSVGSFAATCVVNKSWLAEVLAELSAVGIHPAKVVPENLLIPWQKGQWSVMQDNHQTGDESHWLIRFEQCSGMTVSLANIHFVLQALLNESTETPEHIVIFADAEVAGKVQAQLPPLLQSRVLLRQSPEWSELQNHDAGLNLLQGDFAPQLPWQQWWKQWRLVAMLVVGLFVTDVIATMLQTAKVRQATASVDGEIVELFRSVQPDATIVDPQLQLERAVAALGGRTHEGLTELLERMAPALESSRATEIQNLDYNSSTGELQMVIVSEGFAAAEELRAGLQSLGLDAELLGSSSEGTRNRSRLRVVI